MKVCIHCGSAKIKKQGGPVKVKARILFILAFLLPSSFKAIGVSGDLIAFAMVSLFVSGVLIALKNRRKEYSKWEDIHFCRLCGRHFVFHL